MFLIFILNIKVLFVPIPPWFQMVRHQNCFLFLFVFYVLRHIGYVIFDTMLSSCHPSSFLAYGRGGQSSVRCTRHYLSLGYIGKCGFHPTELATIICPFQNPFSYLFPILWIARFVFWLNGHYLPPFSLPPSVR